MNQTPCHPAQARQLRLPAHPSAVPWARRLLTQALREWGLAEHADTALLVASELVTNAVSASAARTGAGAGQEPGRRELVGLAVRLTDTCLLLEVWDANPDPPIRQEPDLTAECGRGLLIVETLGSKWGHQPADGGKVVWCELELPSRPSAVPACSA